MDIRKADNQIQSTSGNGGNGQNVTANATPTPQKPKFKAGTVNQASASLMIPPAIAAKLSHISKVYNLPIDLSQVSLAQATPDNIKALREITNLLTSNSKLLPELMKLTSQLLKADIKLAEFHKNLTRAAIKHQTKLDKATADIWLMMSGYGSKASRLEHRTNTRTALIEKRDVAYSNYYDTSVYGNESRIIDVEYELAASNQKILSESKVSRLEARQERKQKLTEYLDSAYQ